MTSVLFLSPRFPWPLIGGDRVKAYFLLKHLAKNHNVTLVTFNHGQAPSSEQLEAIEQLGVTVRVARLQPLRAGVQCLRTLWTDLPLEIAFYTNNDFRKLVEHELQQTKPNIVVSFFMRTAEYVRNNTNIPKILVAEDCRVEYQSRSAASTLSFLQRIVRKWETHKLLRYEPSVVEDFDATTFVTAEDVRAMRDLNSRARYEIVTNGVDLDRFSFRADQSNRQGVLFAGKLDVQANHIMAMSIVHDIAPMIASLSSSTTVTIAGANPLNELAKVSSPFIELKSNVPDLVPFLHKAAVFLHPHSGGSGIQNKVLEAMSAGCAVVTTPTGIQGIEAEHGKHCLIGSTNFEHAENTVKLLESAELRETLATNAREMVSRTHSWDVVGQQLDQVMSTTLQASETN